MDQEVLSKFNQPWLPTMALLMFITFFVGYVFWVLKKSNKKIYDDSSTMPLNDGVKHER